jgi:hypothetical protein
MADASRDPERGYDGPEPSLAESDDLHIRSGESDDEDGPSPLPVWMRESSKSFRWRKVPLPIRKFFRLIARCFTFINQWSYGPKDAQIQEIIPWFPLIQEVPLWLVERFLPKKLYKVIALLLFYFTWLLTFCLIIRDSASSGYIEGFGIPNSIWCGANFW